MPNSKVPNYVLASPWDCEIKQEARQATIVKLYHKVFGDSIPKDKQYWTMAGAHFDKDGQPLIGELGQILNNDLIIKTQYYGVDRELSIIEKNKQLFPSVNWIHGDFVEVMTEHCVKGSFNPAIINYDGVMQPKYGTKYLKLILRLIDYNYEDVVMLISNFVLVNPYRKCEMLSYTIEDTLNQLMKIYTIPDHWSVVPHAYEYGGFSHTSRSQMGVIVFIKRKHNIKKLQFSKTRDLGIKDSYVKHLI